MSRKEGQRMDVVMEAAVAPSGELDSSFASLNR